MLENRLHAHFFFVGRTLGGFGVCGLEVNNLFFHCLQFGCAFVEELLEVNFPFSGLFPQFAELGDGFVVMFLCLFGDSNLGLELFFVVS